MNGLEISLGIGFTSVIAFGGQEGVLPFSDVSWANIGGAELT